MMPDVGLLKMQVGREKEGGEGEGGLYVVVPLGAAARRSGRHCSDVGLLDMQEG